MKVLWITNSPFPLSVEGLEAKAPTTGWVYSAANELLEQFNEIRLAVASISDGKELKQINAGKIMHYLIPNRVRIDPNNSKNDYLWNQIKIQFNPDLVHVHGSEYPHSYSFIRAFGAENVVVSIQGMVSVIEKYYFGGISRLDLLKSITLRDIVRLDTIFSQRRDMRLRGRFEKLLIQNVNNVIGRTSWDQSHVWAINSDANYHFCNETLRPSFYKSYWSLQSCEKYSIFISQAYYPLKGFHQLIQALPIVLKHFPRTKVYVAGNDFFSNKGFRISGFASYVNLLINRSKLLDHIIFTGLLDEKSMCQRFINSHLFVSPSAIENSPNSVGEAQLVGVPCIASYVGGTPDMIVHGVTGLLYRFEEVEMLAAYICKLFSDDKLALKISESAKICAAKRHDKKQNAAGLYNIYSKIINQK